MSRRRARGVPKIEPKVNPPVTPPEPELTDEQQVLLGEQHELQRRLNYRGLLEQTIKEIQALVALHEGREDSEDLLSALASDVEVLTEDLRHVQSDVVSRAMVLAQMANPDKKIEVVDQRNSAKAGSGLA